MMTNNTKTKRVLIVDDEIHVATALAHAVTKISHDYQVEIATSGQDALIKIQQTSYALVMTDYQMPGINGLNLIGRIQRLSPDTQIVLMTAFGTDALKHVVDDLELEGYLNKPFSMAKARETVAKLLAQTTETSSQSPSLELLPLPMEQVKIRLQQLQIDTGSYCILLLNKAGHLMELIGYTEGLDIPGVSALIAANFMAAAELATLLGNPSIFKSSYHEGPYYDIYAHDTNNEYLLAVIFGTKIKTGVVRFFTNRLVKELAPLLDKVPKITMIDDGISDAVIKQVDSFWQ